MSVLLLQHQRYYFSCYRTLIVLILCSSNVFNKNNNNNNNNPFLLLCNALFMEDAGILDFVVSTAGHGPTTFVHSYKDSVITTSTTTTASTNDDTNSILSNGSSTSSSSSCYVASRQQRTGALNWRRNICSSSSSSSSSLLRRDHQHEFHAITILPGGDMFFTIDSVGGIVRGWTLDDGSLIWEYPLNNNVGSSTPVVSTKTIWSIPGTKQDIIVVPSMEELIFINAETGKVYDIINAVKSMGGGSNNLKRGQSVQWLSVVPATAGGSETMKAIFGFINEDHLIHNGNDLYFVELEIGNDQFVSSARSFNKGKNIIAETVTIQSMENKKWHALAVTTTGSTIDVSLDDTNWSEEIPAWKLHSKWTQIVSIEATSEPSVIRISGKETSDGESFMSLFRFDNDKTGRSGWERLYGTQDSPDIEYSAVVYCPVAGLVVAAADNEAFKVYRHDSLNNAATNNADDNHERLSPLTLLETTGDVLVPDGDTVTVASILQCSKDKVTVLLGTERGSTTQMSMTVSASGAVDVKVDWTAEEGLSSLSSAMILDASHLGFDDLVEEQDIVAKKLSLTGRLMSQWENTVNLMSAAGLVDAINFSNRDHLFGFVKVAALLSSKAHRLWGMNTAGDSRGTIRWSLDLSKTALWHTMVHGTTNSAKALHGINGDTHSREILVLSGKSDAIDWMCIDGTSGAVNAENSVAVRSPIVQVMPVYGTSTGGCRQASLLLHEDLSVTVVPADPETVALAKKQLYKTQNGLYTHKIGGDTVLTFHVTESESSDSNFIARSVGSTSFTGEKIVQVAYPNRHEEVQSMSTILGDSSLLLKYINPHMAVVVTMLSDEEDQSETKLATTLDNKMRKPRKPVGAGSPDSKPDSSKGTESIPNMFVNLVDTVSGRVLHRTSHSNVDETKEISVVISENWILYTFVNEKSRRTEIGVLTLHEGMIDSKGLTFFSHPEQSTTFSSLDARESKPVVLSKTYAFPKHITALGVTCTRQGISSQNILLAGSDGSLNTIHRNIFETRRPIGEVKPDEKKEGLIPYRELIPDSPLLSLTYNRSVEPFTHIVAADTSLESQSLVLGFGGPDLFFTRTSPTKGFDLLPETFNKILVGAATVGIVIALFVVKRMGDRKSLQQAWS